MLKDLINSDTWAEFEEEVNKFIQEELIDVDTSKRYKDVAVEAIANQVARRKLRMFMSNLKLMAQNGETRQKRTFN